MKNTTDATEYEAQGRDRKTIVQNEVQQLPPNLQELKI